MPNFPGVLEPRFAHEAWDAAFDVVPQMLAAVKKTSEEATQPSPRFAKVKKVKRAAWLEHSPDFAERRELFVPGEMVEHEGGEHPIEGCFRIRKFVREPAIEFDSERSSPGLPLRDSERSGIRVEPEDVGPWM